MPSERQDSEDRDMRVARKSGNPLQRGSACLCVRWVYDLWGISIDLTTLNQYRKRKMVSNNISVTVTIVFYRDNSYNLPLPPFQVVTSTDQLRLYRNATQRNPSADSA